MYRVALVPQVTDTRGLWWPKVDRWLLCTRIRTTIFVHIYEYVFEFYGIRLFIIFIISK